jgi:Flp pilus assembly protein TadB
MNEGVGETALRVLDYVGIIDRSRSKKPMWPPRFFYGCAIFCAVLAVLSVLVSLWVATGIFVVCGALHLGLGRWSARRRQASQAEHG